MKAWIAELHLNVNETRPKSARRCQTVLQSELRYRLIFLVSAMAEAAGPHSRKRTAFGGSDDNGNRRHQLGYRPACSIAIAGSERMADNQRVA